MFSFLNTLICLCFAPSRIVLLERFCLCLSFLFFFFPEAWQRWLYAVGCHNTLQKTTKQKRKNVAGFPANQDVSRSATEAKASEAWMAKNKLNPLFFFFARCLHEQEKKKKQAIFTHFSPLRLGKNIYRGLTMNTYCSGFEEKPTLFLTAQLIADGTSYRVITSTFLRGTLRWRFPTIHLFRSIITTLSGLLNKTNRKLPPPLRHG